MVRQQAVVQRFARAGNNLDDLICLHGADDTRHDADDTIIPFNKYLACFTDTFRNYAIVATNENIMAIDRQEKILYEVFLFDNGPDYPAEGLFRIVQNNKIGFADALTGKIVIQPQFTCAYPFEGGKAKVSNNCTIKPEGEHSLWISDTWDYIDKTGKVLSTHQ